MAPEECGSCKLPFYYRLLARWNNNGTIGLGPSPYHRVVLVESDMLDDIYRRIESHVGVNIRHIVFEAERAASKATIDAMVPGPLMPFIRNRLVMHPVSRGFQHLARYAGLADAHTVFYHVFGGSMAEVRNPMNRDIFAAMVVGAFESAEGIPHDSDWAELGSRLYLIIMPAKARSEIADRMVPEVVRPLRGKRRLERCPGCGRPSALSHLSWNVPDAYITDTRRGVRMSFVDGYAFSTVFRELVAELGDEIIPVIIEASTDYTLRMIKETAFLEGGGGSAEHYDRFLELLPVYGEGNPVRWSCSGGRLSVTVENPYSEYLLAGQMLAVYETVEGKTGSVTTELTAPQTVEIVVRPYS